MTSRLARRNRRNRRILISNDDGVYSPALSALAEVAGKFGHVKVYAPDVDRASSGHAMSPDRPISWKATRLAETAYRVDGTPADCVALGLAKWKGVDVVLAGINLGTNLDNRIWNSSTVAAAKEAVLLGSRGIALSMAVRGKEPDYKAVEPVVTRVLELLLPLEGVPLLNVNFPAGPVKGLRWTRVAVRTYRSRVTPHRDPYGNRHSWFSVSPHGESGEDTDVWAVEHGYVSITPLSLDVTDEGVLLRCRDSLPRSIRPARSAVTPAGSRRRTRSARSSAPRRRTAKNRSAS